MHCSKKCFIDVSNISHLAVKSHFFLPGSTELPATAKTPGCIASCSFSLSSGISLHFATKTVTSELRPTVTAPCHLPVAISSPIQFCLTGSILQKHGCTHQSCDCCSHRQHCSSTCTAMAALTANPHQ